MTIQDEIDRQIKQAIDQEHVKTEAERARADAAEARAEAEESRAEAAEKENARLKAMLAKQSWSREESRAHRIIEGENQMNCPNCNQEMRKGFLFATKDGAFSFANEVPSMVRNAKTVDGFVEITPVRPNHRVRIEAFCCESCRLVQFRY